MKTLSASILIAAAMMSAAILYSGIRLAPVVTGRNILISDDLRVQPVTINRDLVRSIVTDPANHDRLREIRAKKVDPEKPLWIRATSDGKTIVVAYKPTEPNSPFMEVWLEFKEDQFGRWRSDTEPAIFLNN